MSRTRDAYAQPLPPRLAATFALIPLSFGAIFVAYVVAMAVGDYAGGLLAVVVALYAAPLLTFYGGGLLIWWGTVKWTRRRRLGVAATTAVLLLLGAGAMAVCATVSVELGVILILLTTFVGGGVALIVVNRICWTPPDVLAQTVPCPNCGRDLRGARRCRCPACGREYTLAELVESTRVADAIGITSEGACSAGEAS